MKNERDLKYFTVIVLSTPLQNFYFHVNIVQALNDTELFVCISSYYVSKKKAIYIAGDVPRRYPREYFHFKRSISAKDVYQ